MDKPCRPCGDPSSPIDAVTVALVVILAILIIYYLSSWLSRGTRDRFASQRAQEVYRGSQEVFKQSGGNATYSEYKSAVPNTDPVVYNDTRALWKKGNLSAEAVQNML